MPRKRTKNNKFGHREREGTRVYIFLFLFLCLNRIRGFRARVSKGIGNRLRRGWTKSCALDLGAPRGLKGLSRIG